MRLYLFVALIPILFSSTCMMNTDTEFQLSNEMKYQLFRMVYSTDFQSIPSNPNVYNEIDSFTDRELTQLSTKIVPNQKITIKNMLVNSQGKQVFQLEDGRYAVADQRLFYDDVMKKIDHVKEKKWLKKGFIVYSSPIGNKQKILSTNLSAYTSVQVVELAETPVGVFARIDGVGWLSLNDLSEEDNRMEAVQQLLDEKYPSDNIAIYVKQLSTGRVAGVHQDKQMYSASVAKLPILYYVQEQVDNQSYSLTQGLQYTDDAVKFKGSFDSSGSGTMVKTPDNQYYRLDDLISKTAKESDNVASNLLAYYVTNQFDNDYQKTISKIAGQSWDMVSRQASPKMAGLVMEAIYTQNGFVLDSLFGTDFDDQRISRDIDVTVAHKIGDAYDFKHDVALVYADSPFILSIFTEQSSYDVISQIADDIYKILK